MRAIVLTKAHEYEETILPRCGGICPSHPVDKIMAFAA
jgi:hypothetical protein